LLNSFQEDSDLGAVAARNGITRDPGSFATGDVVFQLTSDAAVIPAGTAVTTDPVGDAEPVRFETTEEASASAGDTELAVPVQAVERGREGNVGSGSITRLPSPPPLIGGDPAVNNPSATTGGENQESNSELRNRARRALVGSAGGGTTEGIESGLVEAFDGLDLNDVQIDESVASGFDVVVDGGPSDSDLAAEIDRLQPVAIDGKLIRPTSLTTDIDATVTGTDIDTTAVSESLRQTVSQLGLGSDIIRDQIIADIITADQNIIGIDSLTVTVNGTVVSGDRAVAARESPEPGSIVINVS
jgi:hypothetical protein